MKIVGNKRQQTALSQSNLKKLKKLSWHSIFMLKLCFWFSYLLEAMRRYPLSSSKPNKGKGYAAAFGVFPQVGEINVG